VRGVEYRVRMPHEGLMAMVGVWGRVWFVCRGIVSRVKRVWGGTQHVHSPKPERAEPNRKYLVEGLTRRRMMALTLGPRGKI